MKCHSGKIKDGGKCICRTESSFAGNLQISTEKCSRLSQTDNPAIMSSISKFFIEVEAGVELLEEKYRDQSRNREVQQLVGTQSMVINALKKIHEKIDGRLHTTPSMATPWKGEFTLDLPREVFRVILNHIIQRNSYGHRYKESDAVIDVELTQLRKAVFIFDKMNLEGDLIAKAELLKKNFSSGKGVAAERCEVVITESKPMRLKYRKNSEVLSVTFHYGYWNQHGIPQH